jgi:hypothetical protein
MGRRTPSPERPGWLLAAFALAVAASGALAFLPTTSEEYAVQTVSSSKGNEVRRVEGGTVHRTLLDSEGPSVLIPLAIPVGLTGVAAAVRRGRTARRVTLGATILLAAFCFLGAMSIGMFFVPAAVAMGFSLRRAPPPRRTRRAPVPG